MDIGQILLEKGLLTEGQVNEARSLANGKRFDQIVVEMGYVTEHDSLEAIADELGMQYVDLQHCEIDLELLSEFPTTAIFRHSILPLRRENGRVLVATGDPFDLEALDELGTLSNQRLVPVLARKRDVDQLIRAKLGVGGDTVNQLVRQQSDAGVELLEEILDEDGELDEQTTASVIRLVNELLIEALNLNASDVHIEPGERGLKIRYRVDGLLRLQPVPAEINQFYSAIVTRLKIMSHLNIAEKRRPQDGRIKLRIQGREVDVRVSIIPMMHGEGICLRILDKERMVFNLENVGMPSGVLDQFRRMIQIPHGIILVTGPTGSGKTTTLYSALNEIKDPSVKIITVEDPVEYHSDGISQIQVHSKIGLTFAAGLRSILRHDPDVVLIGEIRDGETAESAIQAAMTGHLVFSTLHTNDAPGAITRLVDMGVEPYLVASTVEAVLAQRLLRKLCSHCKEEYSPDPDDVPGDFPESVPGPVYRAVGCRECGETGYSGRTGVYELLPIDQSIRKLCVEQASATEIRQYALANGMTTLRMSGWQRVLEGITSIDEVMRISKEEI